MASQQIYIRHLLFCVQSHKCIPLFKRGKACGKQSRTAATLSTKLHVPRLPLMGHPVPIRALRHRGFAYVRETLRHMILIEYQYCLPNKKARILRHELLTLLTIHIRQSIKCMGWPVGAQEASDLASTARLQLASVMRSI